MKGQEITPWSIYNNYSNVIMEKSKNSTERNSPEVTVVFPSLKNNT